MKRPVLLIFSILFFSAGLAAQFPILAPLSRIDPRKMDAKASAERIAKQMTIADRTLDDVAALRLGENRAMVLARVGGLVWKIDKAKAQPLFQRAINELIAAQTQADAEQKAAERMGFVHTNVRDTVLWTIGQYDAEFALDSFYRSRPPAVQAAMDQAPEANAKIGDVNSSALVANENNLEQRLMNLVARQSPEKAAKLIQDALKKGLSMETLSLLRQLYQTDAAAANSLASETLDKLLASTFSTNAPSDQTNYQLATAILLENLRDKKPDSKELTFPETGMRELANKLITFYVGSNSRYVYGNVPQLIQIAEKFSPGSVPALKKLEKSTMPPRSPGYPNSDAQKLIRSNLTPSQLATEAGKMPMEARSPVLQQAANRMAQDGDMANAVNLLNENFTGGALENATSSLKWWYAGHLINQGKWDEAVAVIDEMNESNRRSALITLATQAFAKDPVENRKLAVACLEKVRASLPDRPTDQNELTQFTQLAAVYSRIDADRGFSIFESVVPVINELADANAIVQGFQNRYNVRSGEFMINGGGNFGLYFDQGVFSSLAKADFDRTLRTIDSLSRREMRIDIRLKLAESGLN